MSAIIEPPEEQQPGQQPEVSSAPQSAPQPERQSRPQGRAQAARDTTPYRILQWTRGSVALTFLALGYVAVLALCCAFTDPLMSARFMIGGLTYPISVVCVALGPPVAAMVLIRSMWSWFAVFRVVCSLRTFIVVMFALYLATATLGVSAVHAEQDPDMPACSGLEAKAPSHSRCIESYSVPLLPFFVFHYLNKYDGLASSGGASIYFWFGIGQLRIARMGEWMA